MTDINKHIILDTKSIRQAIRIMDSGGIGFCVCINNESTVIGVLTDGDFRRAVLSEVSLDQSVEEIINKNFIFVQKEHSNNEIREIFTDSVVQHIPVLDGGKLIDIYTEEAFFGIENRNNKTVLSNAVVIMAGGKGTRMDPFTRILPKPLIPIGNEPIIKVIMDEFKKFGMDDFHVSINDKGQMIKAYFHDHDLPYGIQYIEEDKPFGTAGSLLEMKGKFNESFFVSNCDIILRTDYSSILDFHVKGEFDLTLVASMRHYVIPYGICDVDKGGDLKSLKEKPEYDFLVNTGVYILEPKVLELIPSNTYFDMTSLINEIKNRDMKVGVFPVSEKSWADVGQWEEYSNTMKNFVF